MYDAVRVGRCLVPYTQYCAVIYKKPPDSSPPLQVHEFSYYLPPIFVAAYCGQCGRLISKASLPNFRSAIATMDAEFSDAQEPQRSGKGIWAVLGNTQGGKDKKLRYRLLTCSPEIAFLQESAVLLPHC